MTIWEKYQLQTFTHFPGGPSKWEVYTPACFRLQERKHSDKHNNITHLKNSTRKLGNDNIWENKHTHPTIH